MKTFVENYLKDNKSYFKEVSSYIYHHPETRFEEYSSSEFWLMNVKDKGLQ